mmetsp:Transcript_17208/g.28800  ORF Transcript_17208/g.28800 Transcript_17208/m.28800 type:complete len:223 (-) Transcript_17208:110-778(-)|eukprot:CAMPEP_0114415688 /NCGR_PEP_ID=MMETSP0103-20121206/2041_1 /TAXON_ID=37642 ORGANISM="Paraphysomonas imperforata, Strain PA2" /NCGR_SAMPLE_ID=MMETSP0103 /ASSEMBLY_ACC=CAM_ASM_000201 /LENGTH=222 /DNA_ID=CAMNT_0001583885 /DNA_START=118 /DNA_END=786 /DNA_ORIENTATION=+
MNEFIIIAAVGIACLLLILLIIRHVRICKSPEDVEEEDSEPQQYEMSPSEIHEFHDFEKAIGGEIYVEKQAAQSNKGSPNPKGFEKFRRIPSLATERTHRKLKRHLSDQHTEVSDQETTAVSSFESVEDTDTMKKKEESRTKSMISEFTHETVSPPVPLSDRSGKTSMDSDSFLRPISTRTAKSYMLSHFSNSVEASMNFMRKPANIQEAELFSIANDEANF